jgi:DNA-binding transcriptional regulator YiaG
MQSDFLLGGSARHEIRDKVRELRTGKKLTQAELGKFSWGNTVRTVAGWDNDGRYPQKRELY